MITIVFATPVAPTSSAMPANPREQPPNGRRRLSLFGGSVVNPSRLAAFALSTTVGSFSVASSRKRPH
jgi:hypothetical protein